MISQKPTNESSEIMESHKQLIKKRFRMAANLIVTWQKPSVRVIRVSNYFYVFFILSALGH
jgi:hypothetical protein